jgi:hypothetical protein
LALTFVCRRSQQQTEINNFLHRDPEEKMEAMTILTNHIIPGTTLAASRRSVFFLPNLTLHLVCMNVDRWENARLPTPAEIKATKVTKTRG